jgi:hypothetical protein
VNISNIPSNTGISALPLIIAVEDLAGAAYVGQVRSLVVQRQTDLSRFVADTVLSTELQASQADLRQHVTHYLDRLIPETIRVVTTLENCTAIVLSVRKEFSSGLDRDTVQEVRGALLSAFEEALASATETGRLVDRELQAVRPSVGAMARVIDEHVKQLLDEERGQFAVLETDIAAVSKNMTDAVEQTVKSGRKIGVQVKKIVTWIFSLFGAGGDDSEKPKEKEKPEGEGDGDKTEKPGKPNRHTLKKPDEPFPGETIGEISDETSAVLAAGSDLNRHAARLQTLYCELCTLRATLGVAVLIKQQGLDYLNAVTQLRATTAGVAEAWRTLVKASDELGTPGAPGFDASWEQLGRRINWIKDSFTGGAAAIPQLGRVENVVPIDQPGENS